MARNVHEAGEEYDAADEAKVPYELAQPEWHGRCLASAFHEVDDDGEEHGNDDCEPSVNDRRGELEDKEFDALLDVDDSHVESECRGGHVLEQFSKASRKR